MAPPRRRRRRAVDPNAYVDYVPSLPWLGTTWKARKAAYWWRRVGLSLVILFAVAVDVGCIAGVLVGIWRDSAVTFRVALVVLAVAAVATAIPTWAQTSPHRIEQQVRARAGLDHSASRAAAGAGAGLGTLARAGSPLAGLLLFVLAVLTVGPVIVVFLRSCGREVATERRQRTVLGWPHP